MIAPIASNGSTTNMTTVMNTAINSTSTSISNSTSSESSTTVWMTTFYMNGSHCEDGQPWIRDHLGDCIETPGEYFSFSIGIIAMGLWLIAHFFLFRSRHDNTDSSCSRLCLILTAAMGSVCNLIGAVLCDQLGTQELAAGYLVISDVIFLLQWIYWWNKNRKLNTQGLSFYVASEDWKSPDKAREENGMNGGGALILCLCIPWIMTAIYWPVRLTLTSPWEQSIAGAASLSPGGRRLLMVSDSSTDNFGYAMGFAALVFYSIEKIPTAMNMVRRKDSCKESIPYHFFIISANVIYFISILSFSIQPTFLTNALPWLLMSLSVGGISIIIVLLLMKNRGVGPNGHAVGRRRADGTLLLFSSEESLNSELERAGSSRFGDDTSSKLPSIKEEPGLEVSERENTEATTAGHEEYDDYEEYDPETASIHSRASDYITDDDEDLYVRSDGQGGDAVRKPRIHEYEDDGLEWDFNDIRPKYGDGDSDSGSGEGLAASPQHLTLGVPHEGLGDDWDEAKVLSEIERELQMGDDMDGDTISMEYDTAEDDDQFFGTGYTYVAHSQ